MNRSHTSSRGRLMTMLVQAGIIAMLFAGCLPPSEPECRDSIDCGGGSNICRSGICYCDSSCPASGACYLTDGCGNLCFTCDSDSFCADDGYCYCTPDCPDDGPCYLTDGCGNDCFVCDYGAYCANDGYCYY